MLTLTSNLLLLAHWIGCLNFMLARLYLEFGTVDMSQSWVVFADLITLDETTGEVVGNAGMGVQYAWCMFKGTVI